jgi:hypothetical protein
MEESTDKLEGSTAISEPSTRQNPFTKTIAPTLSSRNYGSMGVFPEAWNTNETEWTVEEIVARIAELKAIEHSSPDLPYTVKQLAEYRAMVPKDGLSVSEVLKQKEQVKQLRTREEELAQFLQELEKTRKQIIERHCSRREQREKLLRVLGESGEFCTESNEFMAQLRKEDTECPKQRRRKLMRIS